MAVPRTPDGSVGSRSRVALTVFTAVAAVVVVVCLAVLGVRYADTSGSVGDRVGELFGGDSTGDRTAEQEARARELVMSQANQFVLRLNTYGPSDLDKQNTMPGYVERVREVITPKFAVDFEKNVTFAEQTVAKAGLSRSVEIYATGTESLDSDLASVLVTGALSQSYPDPAKDGRIEEEPLLFRLQVKLVRTEGRWLVDDFVPVQGEVAGEQTGAPAPTAEPGDESTSPIVQRYAEIVANRRVSIDEAVATLDGCGFPLPASAGDPTCTRAPRDASDAARSLVRSLQAAANPDSQVFVGAPPALIADLVEATRTAGSNVARAVSGVSSTCITADSEPCTARRTTASKTLDTLTAAVDAWKALQ